MITTVELQYYAHESVSKQVLKYFLILFSFIVAKHYCVKHGKNLQIHSTGT